MNALGEFLRREEVATLAGISADYYLRLEQGRDRNPSVRVLATLARVLRLTDAATAHLIAPGGHLPPRAALDSAERELRRDLERLTMSAMEPSAR